MFALKIALFLFAFVFVSAQSLAGPTDGIRHYGNYPAQPNPATQERPSQAPVDIQLKYNSHLYAYLPRDIHRANRLPTTSCNESGLPTPESPSSGHCGDYLGGHAKWRIRFVEPNGTATQVFLITKNGQLIRHVEFDQNNGSRVTYTSEQARMYARSGGGDTQPARGGNNVPQQARNPIETFIPNLGTAIDEVIRRAR